MQLPIDLDLLWRLDGNDVVDAERFLLRQRFSGHRGCSLSITDSDACFDRRMDCGHVLFVKLFRDFNGDLFTTFAGLPSSSFGSSLEFSPVVTAPQRG